MAKDVESFATGNQDPDKRGLDIAKNAKAAEQAAKNTAENRFNKGNHPGCQQ